MRDHAASQQHHIIADGEVPGDTDCPANQAARTDSRGPRHAGLRGDGGSCTDTAVVRHHHQVIELGTRLDHRVVDRPAINASISADLDIVADDHAPELRHFFPAIRRRRQPETACTDDAAGIQSAPRPDDTVRADPVPSFEPRALTDDDIEPHMTVRGDARACADRRTGINHHQRANLGIGIDPGRGIDHGGRMDAGHARGLHVEQRGDAGKRQIRVACHQCRTAHGLGVTPTDHHHRRRRVGQRTAVFGIGEKAEASGVTGGECAHPGHFGLTVAAQRQLESVRELRGCPDRHRSPSLRAWL